MASTLRFDNWEDSNGTPILDGSNLAIPSSAMPTGSVLQVVEGTTGTSTFITSTSYVDTGLSATITPFSASSKILVTYSAQMGLLSLSSAYSIESTAFRGNSSTGTNISAVGESMTRLYRSPSSEIFVTVSAQQIDSPSTTNSVTYTLAVRSSDGTQVRCLGSQTMVLMEVAG